MRVRRARVADLNKKAWYAVPVLVGFSRTRERFLEIMPQGFEHVRSFTELL